MCEKMVVQGLCISIMIAGLGCASVDQYGESQQALGSDPTYTYCGTWDGKSVYAQTLWKQVSNIRYYIGTSGAAADTMSCIGLWDENAGSWTASRFCKYADQRECQTTSFLGGASQPTPFPACPAGYQPSGNGCSLGCSYPNYLDNGYCVALPSGGGGYGGDGYGGGGGGGGFEQPF